MKGKKKRTQHEWPQLFSALQNSSGPLRRYAKIKNDVADAALFDLAEREGIHTVFTVDQRDFSIYRYAKNRQLKVIPAPAH